jgi:hypothetical protein
MMFCKHKWEVKHDSLTPSIIERAGLRGVTSANGHAIMATRIIIMTCAKCGKIDKTIEEV